MILMKTKLQSRGVVMDRIKLSKNAKRKRKAYAKNEILRVMSWHNNDEFKFERLEYYFTMYLRNK